MSDNEVIAVSLICKAITAAVTIRGVTDMVHTFHNGWAIGVAVIGILLCEEMGVSFTYKNWGDAQ